MVAKLNALTIERDRAVAERIDASRRNREASTIKAVPLDRRSALCGLIDVPGGKGIEFGPLSNPVIGPEEGNIRYVDHACTTDLRQKYAEGHDVSRFVEISYVWSNDPLRNAIHDGTTFDYALASHVIEHVPDVIWWLNEILSVLHEGGILSLAIPDARYTFDYPRALTTAATLIDHWLRRIRGHSAQQVFDFFSQVVQVGFDEITDLFDGKDPQAVRLYTDELAMELARNYVASDKYIECHASVFTPRSFLVILNTLIGLGLIEAELADFYDTRFHTQEFVCVLRKSGARDIGPIGRLIKNIPQ
jgi:SAM-dependent methyltransferase